jgi:hypothetical protein
MHGTNPLVRYESARYALAECHAVDEVKVIHDKAMALQCYAKQAKDTELIEYATEIRLRAERRAGELLSRMEKAKGARGNPNGRGAKIVRSPNETAQPPTLAEMGITKQQSSQWQKFADLSASEFEAKVIKAKAKAARASTTVDEFSGLRDEWITPPEYIEAVRDVLGGIDLDPAPNSENRNADDKASPSTRPNVPPSCRIRTSSARCRTSRSRSGRSPPRRNPGF